MTLISKTPSRHRELGLSLLEVLAAAMIFAMVMTVLISTSSTAVFHIGSSVRRLEASMLADRILADLEIEMKQGIAPEPADEREQDPYTIRVSRTDLIEDLGGAGPDNGEATAVSMLGAEMPDVANHMKRYDIEVSWLEQSGVQSVTRTTFAFDWKNARIELSALFNPPNANGNGADTDGDGDSASSANGGKKRIIYDGHNAANDHRLRLEAEAAAAAARN